MIYIQKIKSAIKLIKGRRWGTFFDRLPLYKGIISKTNLLPHPNHYKYIIFGGHGLGMNAFYYYLQQLGAKPTHILNYEIVRAFIFYRKYDGLVFDKVPLNHDMQAIINSCKKQVYLYQIIRCPIQIIKSNINVTMFHSISQINSQKDAQEMLFTMLYKIEHLMFYFKSGRDLVSHITNQVHYIRTKDLSQEKMPDTLRDFASHLGYKFDMSIIHGGGRKRSQRFIISKMFSSLF